MQPALPARDPGGHKGTFGNVCVIGGQAKPPRVMIGGPALSATAALRTGAGLAVLAVPAPIMDAALGIAPEATGLALPVDAEHVLRPSDVATLLDAHRASFDCFAVGPGWGADVAQQQILARLIAAEGTPLVLDADALNAIAAMPDVQSDFRGAAILTPHPGEYRRLASSLGIDVDPEDAATRREAAETLARRLGCVIVLKGPATVVSDGLETAINDTGNAVLATAGSGDVLTGIIAGLVTQFARGSHDGAHELGLFACARLGVWIHGRAADRWAEEHGAAGLLARDLVDAIPAVLDELRDGARDR